MKTIIFTFLVLISGVSTSAIFQVNLTVQDQVDGNPGDGECEIASGGFCTLRAAIMEANALPGLDIIVLPGDATIRLSITGSDENSAATGDLDITDTVNIGAFTQLTENFPTIDASNINDRVFHILGNSGLVTFVNFRVVNGSAGFSNGGAMNVSINNQVEVIRVWFEDNTADSGGAIYVNALSELNVSDSVFRGNAAVSRGGAVTTFSPTEIDQSTIFENLNFNTGFKEAIFVGLDDFGSSELTLRNSTIFNNTIGIYALESDLSIRNSTIAENTERGIIITSEGGVIPDLRIRNSIFTQNGSNCFSANGIEARTDNWNIADGSFCADTTPPVGGPTNLIEDPKLTNLKVDAENWHRYYRPGFFSPVVDGAHPAAPGPGLGCDLEDQRGVVRPQDGGADGNERCDIGAIELLEDVIFYDDFDIAY